MSIIDKSTYEHYTDRATRIVLRRHMLRVGFSVPDKAKYLLLHTIFTTRRGACLFVIQIKPRKILHNSEKLF